VGFFHKTVQKVKDAITSYVMSAVEEEKKRVELERQIIEKARHIGFPLHCGDIKVSNMHILQQKIKHESPGFLAYFLQEMKKEEK